MTLGQGTKHAPYPRGFFVGFSKFMNNLFDSMFNMDTLWGRRMAGAARLSRCNQTSDGGFQKYGKLCRTRGSCRVGDMGGRDFSEAAVLAAANESLRNALREDARRESEAEKPRQWQRMDDAFINKYLNASNEFVRFLIDWRRRYRAELEWIWQGLPDDPFVPSYACGALAEQPPAHLQV